MTGRRVELGAVLTPSSRFSFERPTADGKDSDRVVARASSTLLQVLAMPREERVALLAEQADDEVLILFAMLRPSERRDIMRAAETFLKEKVIET